MKKILKSLFAIVLCVLTCVSFAGCEKETWSKTTNDTTKVESNGGTTVYHDGWLYFINGTKEVNESNNTGSTIQAGIYRAECDKNGNVLYKEKTSVQANEEDKDDKEFKNVEPVVKSLTGFANGSIHIFGDYLYYVTPSKAKNDEGEMLTGKLAFRRYDLVNKNSELLYTTQASDDTVSYTYYKQNNDLFLLVYEKTGATITSMKMGNNVQKAFVKKEVKSAVFSNNFGVVVNSGTNVTDCYIYYTMNAEGNNKGNRVFRVLPDGKDEKLISEKEDVSLVTIQEGYLVYQKDSITYAEKIVNTTEQIGFTESNIVYYGKYENVIYFDDGGKLGAIVYDKGVIRKIIWNETLTLEENVDNMQPIFDEFDSDDKVSFVGIDGDYLIYQLSNYIYKVKVFNITVSDEVREIKLSTTKMDEPKDDSLISLEIVKGYIYGMYTDSSTKVTYMYRISVQTPKEAGETDGEVGAAEFIGVKE